MSSFDVIVLGLGAMGSAAARALARSGQRVLGLEQFSPVHDRGSSHGESRVIRQAYFEDPRYVPLLLSSYELWRELETESGQSLLNERGCVFIGPDDNAVIQGCLRSAHAHALPHEILRAADARARFHLNASPSYTAFYEPRGGFLYVEKCIEAFLAGARSAGADLRFNQKIDGWQAGKSQVSVRAGGETFTAKKLVLSLGAWTKYFLNGLTLTLSPKRAVMFWFKKGSVDPQTPVFFLASEQGPWVYGFPPMGDYVKVAFHNIYDDCDPDHVRREIGGDEIALMKKYAAPLLPGLGEFSHAKTCMYTMTPDENFILGALHAPNENVFLAGGFSGHGFKFASVVGEIACDFVSGIKRHDDDFLSPYRF